jgi:hypothetical protein
MARVQKHQIAGWQQMFVALLPTIMNYLEPAFCRLKPEARTEAIQEAVANSYVAFHRLVRQGRESLIYPTVLAGFAIKQVRAGRRVGGSMNAQDISSSYAQQKKGIRVERLDRFDASEGFWQEIIVEDDQTPILDQVSFRIDFPAWLETISRRDRQIANRLATGESTTAVARRFGLSLARVSQLRRRFERSWLEFIGEEERRVLPSAA